MGNLDIIDNSNAPKHSCQRTVDGFKICRQFPSRSSIWHTSDAWVGLQSIDGELHPICQCPRGVYVTKEPLIFWVQEPKQTLILAQNQVARDPQVAQEPLAISIFSLLTQN